MVYTGKNRDCLPAITVRCLQLVGHFHPLVFCLIFLFLLFFFNLFPFLPRVLTYFSASLWTCSAPSGGSVASDAACRG